MKEVKNRFYYWIRRIVGPIFMLLFPLDVRGLEHFPQEPVVLCGNHSNALDPLMVVCAQRSEFPLRIMAKQQLMKVPVVGWFIRKMGAFGVDRGNSDINAIKTAIRSLREGYNLLIFPEGTRVKEGEKVEVKGGAAMIAIRSGVKLMPMYIDRKKKLFRKTRIIFGRPYEPMYTGRKGTAEEYQANADEIMRQIYELGETE
ncbi:MAG: 1-acyl-sn-glycerol-3-phosphate acyltransferase [Oscillospiraceae bacterium]|nr:1-acyl-sn-glycerol-3-phosphate acyltransferase [Oscillospiraceae bacterium]